MKQKAEKIFSNQAIINDYFHISVRELILPTDKDIMTDIYFYED